MDYESLIADLQKISQMNSISHYKRDVCAAAATALSALQAENAQLRESRDHWKRLAHELSEGVNGKDAEHERLQAENEKLRAEVESLKKGHCAGCSIPAVKAEQIRDLTDAPKLRAELEQVKKLYESEKEDFIDYACSGVPNLSPYCMNRRPDCVDERGWCRSEKCHGFSRERGQKED